MLGLDVLNIAKSLSRASESSLAIHSDRSTSWNSVPMQGVTSKDLNALRKPFCCKVSVVEVVVVVVVVGAGMMIVIDF